MYYLNINDVITKGKHAGKIVKDIINDKKIVFEVLKDGNPLNDEILNTVNIHKNIRNISFVNEVVIHEKHDKIYPKDTVTLNKILKELETLSNQDYNFKDNTTDNIKEGIDEEL